MSKAKQKVFDAEHLLKIFIDQIQPVLLEADKAISDVGKIARQDFDQRRNLLRKKHEENTRKILGDWND
jgi:hypothetical protein